MKSTMSSTNMPRSASLISIMSSASLDNSNVFDHILAWSTAKVSSKGYAGSISAAFPDHLWLLWSKNSTLEASVAKGWMREGGQGVPTSMDGMTFSLFSSSLGRLSRSSSGSGVARGPPLCCGRKNDGVPSKGCSKAGDSDGDGPCLW